MKVAIINHQCNANAIKLKREFKVIKDVDVCLIDSGSTLAATEKKEFDRLLPNVFYSGLINEVSSWISAVDEDEIILTICSDVEIDQPSLFIKRIREAFNYDKTGVYGGVSYGTSHSFMKPKKGSKGLRRVNFVEGFCFATTVLLYRKMTPIDLGVNRLGHGLDIYLGFLTIQSGKENVVDDGFVVKHPVSTGYSSDKAHIERLAWFKTFGTLAETYNANVLKSKYQQGKWQKVFYAFFRFVGS